MTLGPGLDEDSFGSHTHHHLKSYVLCITFVLFPMASSLAQAMPEEYKDEDPIVAYRNYCINEKHYAKWERGRNKPSWWHTQHEEVA